MSDQCLGEIRMFAGDFAPPGWAFCDGRLLSINEHTTLYSLIGMTYGGDGVTTFALPDLRGRIPIGGGTSQAGTSYAVGQAGGSETVILTTQHLPSHTHVAQGNKDKGTQEGPKDGVWANPNDKKQYLVGEPNQTMDAGAIASAGGGQSHNNVMPYFPLSFIIALIGDYPERS